MIDTESAQLVEACKRRHANQSLRSQPVPELVHLADLLVLEAPLDRPVGAMDNSGIFREKRFHTASQLNALLASCNTHLPITNLTCFGKSHGVNKRP